MILKLNIFSGKDAALVKTMAGRGKETKISDVPAPNAYNAEKGEDYLEGGIQHSLGIKPEMEWLNVELSRGVILFLHSQE